MRNFVSKLRLTLKIAMLIKKKVYFMKYIDTVTESYSLKIVAPKF